LGLVGQAGGWSVWVGRVGRQLIRAGAETGRCQDRCGCARKVG